MKDTHDGPQEIIDEAVCCKTWTFEHDAVAVSTDSATSTTSRKELLAMAINPHLCNEPFPPGLVIKELITGENRKPLFNYEDWLRELVNCSTSFMSKTGGEPFVAPEKEDNGEPDAIASGYSLDFKLIHSESMMRAVRETAAHKLVANGSMFTCTGRSKGEERGVKLYVVLRHLDSDAVRTLWNVDLKRASLSVPDHDVAVFLKTLKKRKNLLLLYPSLMYAEEGFEVSFDDASEAIYSDYKLALDLRCENAPGFETYLAYIMEGQLEVVEVLDSGWRHFDRVPVGLSETFKEICGHYWLEYGLMDQLLGGVLSASGFY